MVRKRTISAVLGDDSRPIAIPSSRMRSISRVFNENPTSSRSRSNLVACNCSKCNGKLVDSRTKRIHQIIHRTDQNSNNSDDLVDITLPIIYLPNELSQLSQQIPNLSIDDNEHEEALTSRLSQQTDEIHSRIEEQDQHDYLAFLPRNRLRRYTNSHVPVSDSNFKQFSDIESTEEDRSTDDSQSEDESVNDDNIHSEEFEDYSTPYYDPNPISSESTNNNRFLRILLWIMEFRTRFNLPETGTEALIKYMKIILTEFGCSDIDDIDSFPNSLYMARKVLGLRDNFQKFAACPNCHKLYQKKKVEEFQINGTRAIIKCQHIEFPNSTARRLR